MDASGLATVPFPRRISDSSLAVTTFGKEDAGIAQPPRPLPFRERRRTRSIEESRHEALESVNRLLLRYEQTHEQLRQEEEKYRSMYQDALIGIFQVSPMGRPLSVNRAMATLCGYESPEQLLAEISHVGHQLYVSPREVPEWQTHLAGSGTALGVETEIYTRDGIKKWVSLNLRAVRDGAGSFLHYEGTAEDITERKIAEGRIHYLAYYDTLTGLPNRTLFGIQLGEALASAQQHGARAALLMLELGRFKIINDTLGHTFGDRLLQEIAERVKRAAGKYAIVSRVGGGEFAIVLPNIETAAEAKATAVRVIGELSSEFLILGHAMNIAFNAGVSIYPENGMNPEALLRSADVAMYSAKEDGPNRFRLFTEEMDLQIKQQLTLENGLRHALDRNELYLVYQPQVNMCTGKITGLEALLRWQHPELGLVPPNDFIGVAEHSGLIVPIGAWVLRTACAQAKAWQDEGLPPVPVAVNVSAVQFRQQGFSELIREVLTDTGLEAKYLELELTESLLLTNADVMFVILQELREMGVKLAIDDFGTGYSSLSYLRQFQVNRLKIDRSFVRDVAVNSDDAAITTAIINMAKALNLEVLAEGVETEAQLSFLREQHCYEIQGYYFSRPVAVGEVMKQLLSATMHPSTCTALN